MVNFFSIEGLWKNDLGIVYLAKPFATLDPKEIRQTPHHEYGTVWGYPGESVDGTKLYKSSYPTAYHPDLTEGLVQHAAETEHGMERRYSIINACDFPFANAVAGNSGGPIVDKHGKVFAIHRGEGETGKGVNVGVAIDRETNDIEAFFHILNRIVKHGFDHGKEVQFWPVVG
jgi:hypothetical protein